MILAFHITLIAIVIFVSIYIPLFSNQSTIKNNFPLAKC
jgi:type II secretory pathway component PulF